MKTVPEDFVRDVRSMLVRGMSVRQAEARYGASSKIIKRWAEECEPGLYEVMASNGRHRSKMIAIEKCRHNRVLKSPLRATRGEPLTIEQEAMRFLQWKKRWVCYSSRIHVSEYETVRNGDGENVRYYVGNRKLTSGELLALAAEHGFEG